MKKHFYLLLIVPFLYNCVSQNQNTGSSAGGGVTRNPNVNRSAADFTEIRKVELTDRYTIIYITHTNNNRVRRDSQGRIINSGRSEIRIKPSSRLLGLNGQRSFRFIRADGIPVDPQYMNSFPGDRVSFVLYYERLDPGIELFDLFECNDYDNMVCWNFYGVKVVNPRPLEVEIPPVVINNPSTNLPGEVELPTQKPQVFVQEILVRGVVKDAKTKKPITAKIDYVLLPKNTPIDSIQSFPGSGEYKVRLQNNQVYTYTVHAQSYLVHSDNIDLTKVTSSQTIVRDILLTPFMVGDKITLKNLFFEVSKFELLPASYAELDRLVGLMKDYPTMQIGLEGHTDVVGDKDANMQLSKDRVNEVKKYLVSKNIKTDRITATGFGATKPIVAKGTDEERKVNRRVEFVILKN
ncbi:MAG: OmpA family protein [Bacteroidota bacterium]